MRSSVSAIFFLAMVPLRLMATDLQSSGLWASNVQDTAVGEAQHYQRGLLRGPGGRHHNNDDHDCSGVPSSTSAVPSLTPAPSATPPVPSTTLDPSAAPSTMPSTLSPFTERMIPSLSPGPSTTPPVSSPTPGPSTTSPVPPPTPAPSTTSPAPLPTPTPSTAPPVPSLTRAPVMTPTDMDLLLGLHNDARCQHNADPLTYSDDVATSALAHAEVLTNSCGLLFHSASEDRNGYGENLYQCGTSSTTSCYTPEAAMLALYEDEIQVDSVTEYGGHATQILWKSTTELGCAVATCFLDPFNYVYLVCQYNPPGNLVGRVEQQVELPTAGNC